MAKKNGRNTRGRIISAAWKLFYEQGYDDTTVDEIVERAETVGELPYIFIGRMEDMGTVLVNGDSINIFRIAVPTNMGTVLDDCNVKWMHVEFMHQSLIDYGIIQASTN